MTRDLERRLRKLESILPPLLTDEVSWMFGLLWFAVAYYLGNPSRDDKPVAAYARALGYANESELNSAMEDNYRDLSNRVCSAEDKVCAKFGIQISSLEDSDSEKLSESVKRLSESLMRMEVGLPQPYKDQLKMVLKRVNNLGWMRVHSDNVALYLRCFGVNPAYLREMLSGLLVEAMDENGGGPGMRLRKRQQKKG